MGEHGGAIGVTFAPSKRQAAAMTGIWERDLATDLAAIRQWGAQDLITLLIRNGARVVVHCKGGLGRAGTVASLLLLGSGTAPSADDAMRQVRAVRRGAIETSAQEAFLQAWPFATCLSA
jgi:hypothetical protein